MLKKHSTIVLNKDYTKDLAYIILPVTVFNMMLQSTCKFIFPITFWAFVHSNFPLIWYFFSFLALAHVCGFDIFFQGNLT